MPSALACQCETARTGSQRWRATAFTYGLASASAQPTTQPRSLVSNVPLKLRTCGGRWALQRVDASEVEPLPVDKPPADLPVLLEAKRDATYVQCRLFPMQGDQLPWASAASSGGSARASRLSDAQLAWLNFDSRYHALLKAEHRAHPLPPVSPT